LRSCGFSSFHVSRSFSGSGVGATGELFSARAEVSLAGTGLPPLWTRDEVAFACHSRISGIESQAFASAAPLFLKIFTFPPVSPLL
jgi:hypothetical protein